MRSVLIVWLSLLASLFWNCGGGFVGVVCGAGVGTLLCVGAGLVLVLGLGGCVDGWSVGGV